MNTLNHIDWNKLVGQLQNNASSLIAQEKLKKLSPKDSPDEATGSFNEITNAEELIKFHSSRLSFDGLDEFSPILRRLEKNAQLDPLELTKTRSFFYDINSLGRQLSDLGSSWCESYLEKITDPKGILSYIDRLIGAEGEIKTDASEELYKCYHEKKDLKNGIHNLLEKLVKQNDLDNILQDRFVTTRDGRWVLPVKNGMQGKFEGIIHDTSQSKQTVFMEPQEVVKSNNRIKELDLRIQNEIDRLLREVSDFLYQIFDDIQSSFDVLVYLDQLFAKALLKKQINAQPVNFTENIQLIDFSNPVLELQKENDEVIIKNTLALGDGKRLLILSGPNAGGKTILLKSVGLAAHMARCGLCIPAAEGSELPFFKNIFISVGDAQNISEGLSTFAGHMKELNQAAQMSSTDTLILVDEICGSTDPEEGSALAKAFIDKYAENHSYTFITSHLGALKQNWRNDDEITHASMEFDEESGRPVYKLLMGISGSSYAWKTAKRIGVENSILDQALEYLSPETQERQKSLEDLEKQREQIAKSRKQIDFELRQAQEQKNKYKKMMENFRQEKDKKLAKSIREAEDRIDKELATARENRKKSAFDLKAELPSIVRKKEESRIDSPEEFNLKFPPGSQVYATNIQKNAIVQSPANNKGDVEILANSMKLRVSWKFLKTRESKGPRFKAPSVSAPKRNDSESNPSQLDLRGKTVDESLHLLDRFCDEALLSGQDKIKVIHGHGTQVLKKAVRMHLTKVPYSERWQTGGDYDGGDGVTWVYFK